jgi:hypothetical protein
MQRVLFPALLLCAGLALGLLSARYLIGAESVAKPIAASGWRELSLPEDGLAATYVAAHFLQRGSVPPPRGVRLFTRTVDDDGNSLRGDCVVKLEGAVPPARWWFVAAQSGDARRMLDAGQAVREANGEVGISISTLPTPGNWLIPAGGGAYELQLVLISPTDVADAAAPPLPGVKRLWC